MRASSFTEEEMGAHELLRAEALDHAALLPAGLRVMQEVVRGHEDNHAFGDDGSNVDDGLAKLVELRIRMHRVSA